MLRRHRSAALRLRTVRPCALRAGCALFVGSCLLLAGVCAAHSRALRRPQGPDAPAARTHYQINFTLDFDRRTFTGTERVRWVNRDTRPTAAVFFHLYANVRGTDKANNVATAGSGDAENVQADDEPRLEVVFALVDRVGFGVMTF